MFSWHRAEGGYRFLLYSAFTFYLLRKVSLALAIFFFSLELNRGLESFAKPGH
ncbi:hypothetical protein ASPFODRAFT_47378 [Aspergillus luchuensis CBS 106.47]|uniref:Uncharacterized protein n=1 Tax=Aspergillus luchuensis (strain CBS 106.47) TaxID=1137211 RepID=A0A1M3THJ5_ASPLC|nr:hypothetical protein ASPFODRAFT_47378 [Aspergillus luchuensis CBS 106.47]